MWHQKYMLVEKIQSASQWVMWKLRACVKIRYEASLNSAQLKVTLMGPLDWQNALGQTQNLSSNLSVTWHKVKKWTSKAVILVTWVMSEHELYGFCNLKLPFKIQWWKRNNFPHWVSVFVCNHFTDYLPHIVVFEGHTGCHTVWTP
jgi:hypothetical protein